MAGGFGLQFFAVDAKSAAFIVVFNTVAVSIYAEQNLVAADFKIFRQSAKCRRACACIAWHHIGHQRLKIGASKVVNQGVHQGSNVLLGVTSKSNLSVVLPLELEPQSRSAEHTQAERPAQ